MEAILQVQLLGCFAIRYKDRSITSLNTPRLQSLLTYLALNRDLPQTRNTLAFLLWPDSREEQARTNLRNLFFLLRNALPDIDQFLSTAGHVIEWRANAPCDIDVRRFEKAVARANAAERDQDKTGLCAALESAVTVYRGDLSPSCYANWILPERERLRQMFVMALERLVDLSESQDDYHTAIRYAQTLLRFDPLHESTYRWLMRLYALNGDRGGAMQTYYDCTVFLREEFGVEPSLPTRQLYEQLFHKEAASEAY